MPETIQLNQNFGWKNLGTTGMRLRAPGLTGNLVWRSPAEHAPLMANSILPGVALDMVEQALQEAGLTDQGSVTVPSGSALIGPPAQLVLDRPIAQGQVEFAIYRDESGVISLHRPLPSPPTAAILAAPAEVPPMRSFQYVIPLRHAATPPGGVPQMAMLGGIAGKVIRFVGRVATGFLGDAVYVAAKAWEDQG